MDPRHSLTAIQAPPCGKGDSIRESLSLCLLHIDLKVNLQIFLHHSIMHGPARSMTQASSLSFIYLDAFSPSDHSHDPFDDSCASACKTPFLVLGRVVIAAFQSRTTSPWIRNTRGRVALPQFWSLRTYRSHLSPTWHWLPPIDLPSDTPRLSCLIKTM